MAMRLIVSLLALCLFAAGPVGASDKVHVEFWTMSLKPKFTSYFKALVTKYEAMHPNVELEWVDVPWDAMQTKLTASIVAESAPALVQLNVPWAYDYALYGALRPVDDLLGADRANYTDGAIADLTFNGKVYGFPHYNSVNVMAYNTTLFKAAGITHIPTTRDEQLAVAKQIKARTGQYGFSPALGKIAGVFLEEGLPLVEHGKAVFNSPAHIALIGKLADAYKAGGLLKDKLFSEDNYPASIDAYKSGRMAMLEAPPSALIRVRDDANDIYAVTDVAPVPIGANGIAAGGWLFLFAMPKGTTGNVAIEAARFAKYLTDDDNQLAFAELAGAFPTAKKAVADARFQHLRADGGAYEKAMAIGATRMNVVRTLYVAGVPGFERLNKRLQDAVEAAIIGRRDIKSALDDAVAFWNSKLAH
ncbi:MAG TPA: sugar ABC transporter substrate-binding protein [Casimicrobiaceae bacterium]|nr:sugar ABC transporter substrate-binding protein [Casimicrobiaceae bacterium]